MQSAARIFGEITERLKGHPEEKKKKGGGCKRRSLVLQLMVPDSAWLVTCLGMECGPRKAGTKFGG